MSESRVVLGGNPTVAGVLRYVRGIIEADEFDEAIAGIIDFQKQERASEADNFEDACAAPYFLDLFGHTSPASGNQLLLCAIEAAHLTSNLKELELIAGILMEGLFTDLNKADTKTYSQGCKKVKTLLLKQESQLFAFFRDSIKED